MLPKPKTTDRQHRLFPQPIGNHGHVRIALGFLTERLTASLFGGHVLRTDSRVAYCPDVMVPASLSTGNLPTFLECKAMGKSKGSLIYSGRLEKDKLFAKYNRLYYVIWEHDLDTLQYQTVEELEVAYLLSIRRIYVMPFRTVARICLTVPVTKLNSNYGHSDTNPVYGAGYRIPAYKLKAAVRKGQGIAIKWHVEKAAQKAAQVSKVQVT